jgi:hypothetical protein
MEQTNIVKEIASMKHANKTKETKIKTKRVKQRERERERGREGERERRETRRDLHLLTDLSHPFSSHGRIDYSRWISPPPTHPLSYTFF